MSGPVVSMLSPPLTSRHTGTWDMEEFLSKQDEIVNGDKLKVRMIV